MFTAVLVFASPAGKTMASQVSENQTQSIAENVNNIHNFHPSLLNRNMAALQIYLRLIIFAMGAGGLVLIGRRKGKKKDDEA